MIKLSLNTPSTANSTATSPAQFSSALAAAVEAASILPAQPESKESLKPGVPSKLPTRATVRTNSNSSGLLSRGMKWLQAKGRSKKRLHMIETVSLGDKRFVALVKVDGREFLLGGAPSSVGMLADLGTHGLTELLNAPSVSAAVAEVAAISSTSIAFAEVEPHGASSVAATEPLTQATLPSTVEPFSVANPGPSGIQLQANANAAKSLDVFVAADEDEPDWLLQDDIADQLKSALEMEPCATAKHVSADDQEAAVEIIAPAATEATEKPVPVPVCPSQSPKDFNFTFQMWPAPQTGTTAIRIDATHPVPASTKGRTPVDLEACPELLGEPYLLSIVSRFQGVAA